MSQQEKYWDRVQRAEKFGIAKCPECLTIFDLLNEAEAEAWAFGHDCEIE